MTEFYIFNPIQANAFMVYHNDHRQPSNSYPATKADLNLQTEW